jgi:protein-S-isoprenylcysteine O-methyltransferase Ste14
VYGQYDKSLGPKTVLMLFHAAGVCAAAWILFGDGFTTLFHWTGKAAPPDHVAARALLFACAAIYFARICFGTFHLYNRKVSYGEAIGVGIFAACLHVLFAFLGRADATALDWLSVVGIFLYLAGSCLNTASEYLRYLWKKNPVNEGQLYTKGLFHYARHINYFGDVVLFTGYALLTGSPWALIVPALMLCGFVFVNIPMLDGYLRKKYGAQFDAYALQTQKLIPYVY